MSEHSRNSCLYQGMVSHHRRTPNREFRHAVVMTYVDLDELPNLLNGRFLRRLPGLMRFRRRDYHGDPRLGLGEAVRNTVERELGVRPVGPIRVLTNLRSLAFCFNPVSFYYCFDTSGEQLQAVLAEVTNTPWGERQAYVIARGYGRFDKRMHVSPFMPMDQSYTCHAGVPADRITLTIESSRSGTREFAAALQMRRRELTPSAMRSLALRYRVAPLRTLVLIYGHALAIRLAGVRSYRHPPRRAV